ncbi:MAG: hypothetical protein A2289_13185 [Deltaproteobacteria bacterium RIFOXYA12_FULL_58_15]|nr:MAG: hypothetical protein A2289_13185 [Deltaproteobacteria bacterium RIFOXYA12_FULL_58_15]OGR09444.1 MAG: hypothetical protein A2341_18180 [Deltaproteobacteria bacterium RIFOXYB12_FULL_58_9]
MRRRILHCLHDFLPDHRAGVEIYVHHLATTQQQTHDVAVLCATYDPRRRHGSVTRRQCDRLPVIEIVNNWRADTFVETYAPKIINESIRTELVGFAADIVHVHNLLNLSFALPALAVASGARVVATLHDYTLLCPSGGQRVHVDEKRVCHEIDPKRCVRCFLASPHYQKMVAPPLPPDSRLTRWTVDAARSARKLFPKAFESLLNVYSNLRTQSRQVTARDVSARLLVARRVADDIEVFVSPSRALADEYVRHGFPEGKMKISDYGFVPMAKRTRRVTLGAPLRLGFVGTLAWHKGVHVLIRAVEQLPPQSVEVLVFGSPRTVPTYSAQLKKMGQGLPVDFRGSFAPNDVANVFAQIDILVVPSLWLENSPLVIHEAQLSHVPVVGSKIGGIGELVRDDVDGLLFVPGSADSLAGQLRRLIEDRSLVERLARNAPVVKTMDCDAAEWDAIYEGLLCAS